MRDVEQGMADNPSINAATVGLLVKAKWRIWPVLRGQVVTHLIGTTGSSAAAKVQSTSATQRGFGVHHPSGKAQTVPLNPFNLLSIASRAHDSVGG